MKALLLLILALPVYAQAPALQAREISVRCEKAGCMVSKDDMEYLIARDAALTQIAVELSKRLNGCLFRGA